jgi:copper resistance protein D
MEAGLIAARFAHYAALALAFGAFAYAGFVEQSATTGRRLRGLGLASSLMLLFAAVGVLAATVAGLGGDWAAMLDPGLWTSILNETDFGGVWSARIIIAVVLVGLAVAVWLRPARLFARLGSFVAGALVVSVALTGHAQIQEGTPGLIHRVADAAHLLAAAVWLGALPPLLLLLRSGRTADTAEDASFAVTRLEKFHSIGPAAVVTLVATGIVNSWFLVGSFERLFTTTYGLVLVVKLALFALMLALAADNRFRLVPALRCDLAEGGHGSETMARLKSRIRGEFALGMLVLLAVSVLGAIAPASA